jgi:hypothetical protein
VQAVQFVPIDARSISCMDLVQNFALHTMVHEILNLVWPYLRNRPVYAKKVNSVALIFVYLQFLFCFLGEQSVLRGF